MCTDGVMFERHLDILGVPSVTETDHREKLQDEEEDDNGLRRGYMCQYSATPRTQAGSVRPLSGVGEL